MIISYDSVHYHDESRTDLTIDNLVIDNHPLGNCVILNVTSQLGYLIIQNELSKGNEILTAYEDDESQQLTIPELITAIQVAVQGIIDGKAKEKLYDDGFALCGYADSTNEQFRSEALRFIRFRDLCWVKCYEILNKYNNGEIRRPTVEDVVLQLPDFDWDTVEPENNNE
jgi:hypothetical protein